MSTAVHASPCIHCGRVSYLPHNVALDAPDGEKVLCGVCEPCARRAAGDEAWMVNEMMPRMQANYFKRQGANGGRGRLLVGSSPLQFVPLVLDEIRGRRILDVGCGCGVYGYLLRNKWQDAHPGRRQFDDFAARDVSNDEPEYLAGIDIQTENVRRCSGHSIYDFLALGRADELPFPDDFFDSVLCVEVLEHLTKDDALKALGEFERVATQRIILTVPTEAVDEHTGRDERHFLKVDTSDPEVAEWVEAERHKSSWTARELKGLGFRVGREVRRGLKAPYDLALNYFYARRWGQLLAVKDLGRGAAPSRAGGVKLPPRLTEGFPDYR